MSGIMSPIQLLSSLLRAALLLSPATIAVLMFIYLLENAENRGGPERVDTIHTATIR